MVLVRRMIRGAGTKGSVSAGSGVVSIILSGFVSSVAFNVSMVSTASDDAFAAGLLVMPLGCADACDVASASFTGEGDASGISTCATCIGTVLLPLKSEGITTISKAMDAAAEVIHNGHKGLV